MGTTLAIATAAIATTATTATTTTTSTIKVQSEPSCRLKNLDFPWMTKTKRQKKGLFIFRYNYLFFNYPKLD